MRLGGLALSLLLPFSYLTTSLEIYKPGSFQGTLKLQSTDDGVHWSVIEDFKYIDGYGRSLDAGPGFLTDGASIPRALWSLVGSPFTGKYVKAAIIHDVGCTSHKYTWQETHRLFYDAMLDSDVDKNYAKLLYYGVRFGGPKWKEKTIRADEVSITRSKVEAKGGTLVVEHDSTDSASYSQPDAPRHVLIEYPQITLTTEKLINFKRELERREVAHRPVTQEEIEARTVTLDTFR